MVEKLLTIITFTVPGLQKGLFYSKFFSIFSERVCCMRSDRPTPPAEVWTPCCSANRANRQSSSQVHSCPIVHSCKYKNSFCFAPIPYFLLIRTQPGFPTVDFQTEIGCCQQPRISEHSTSDRHYACFGALQLFEFGMLFLLIPLVLLTRTEPGFVNLFVSKHSGNNAISRIKLHEHINYTIILNKTL